MYFLPCCLFIAKFYWLCDMRVSIKLKTDATQRLCFEVDAGSSTRRVDNRTVEYDQSWKNSAHPKQKNSQTKITTVSDIKWGSTMLHTPLRLAIFFCINKSQSFMIR